MVKNLTNILERDSLIIDAYFILGVVMPTSRLKIPGNLENVQCGKELNVKFFSNLFQKFVRFIITSS